MNSEVTPCFLFVDMNSFFATCEQQVNKELRGKPVGVCVYLNRFAAIIAASVDAKKKGVKGGMRMNEALKICPDIVAVETHPNLYREMHIKIMNVLRKYSDKVIPKSIDEAVVDLTGYHLVYKDPQQLAKQIKHDIRTEVGDYLTCSIGIAPNAFLAKLASNVKKPDGLTTIMPDTIDGILKNMKLTDLPGIARGMATRLEHAGIRTPLELRYAKPHTLKAACRSVVGLYWHQRLNFQEVHVDTDTHEYKSMAAQRMISRHQREKPEQLQELLLSLCLKLEGRMVKQGVFARNISVYCRYIDGYEWGIQLPLSQPVQDGIDVLHLIKQKMEQFEKDHETQPLINAQLTSLGVTVSEFVPDSQVQYNLFTDHSRKDKLRKTVYGIKGKFGSEKLIRAAELSKDPVLKDVIGFGSIKDLHEDLNKVAGKKKDKKE
jgi:DNA polymerase-4